MINIRGTEKTQRFFCSLIGPRVGARDTGYGIRSGVVNKNYTAGWVLHNSLARGDGP